jgi:single-strand DNA-binding protein
MKNITIAGNCTKDGEMRNAGSSQVCGFSVAVNGFANREKTVHYFDVSIWGKRGENAMQFAQKGAKICVTGDLGTREHNGKTYLTINASDFTPMGGGSGGGQSGGDQGGGGSGYGGGGQPSGGIEDDEIPF